MGESFLVVAELKAGGKTYRRANLVSWDPACPLESSAGPFGPEFPEKSLKESPNVFRPQGPKSVRN